MPPDQRKKVQHLGGNLAIVKVVLAEVLGFHLGQLVEQLVGQVRASARRSSLKGCRVEKKRENS